MWKDVEKYEVDRVYRLKKEYDFYDSYRRDSISPRVPFCFRAISKNGSGDLIVSMETASLFSRGDFSGYVFKEHYHMFEVLVEKDLSVEDHNCVVTLLNRLPV